MHRLVPDFILHKFAHSQTSGTMQAAALFVDLSGFSVITDALLAHGQHGAEVLSHLMQEVFAPQIAAVYAQSGFVATMAGDAYTALFPLQPGESVAQPALRALATALQVQEEMGSLGTLATPYGAYVLKAKGGLALGSVQWGIASAPALRRGMFYFRGDAVDGCAAAEKAAVGGELWAHRSFVAAIPAVAAVAVDGPFSRIVAAPSALPAPQPFSPQPVAIAAQSWFFPQDLLEQPYPGEFRHVVNLFISLPNARTDDELQAFAARVFALQARFGGLLTRIDFGDKGANMLLFWGAPQATERDVPRALAFVDALREQSPEPIQAGVAFRIAHAGFSGSALRQEYTCYGRGVNLAARLMRAAPAGEIWVDEEAARRATGRYQLAAAGMRQFKGFETPQAVYVLQRRQRRAPAVFTGQMIGRRTEAGQVARFLQPLWQGDFAGALLLRGESGIGKSRLVHAVQQETASRGRAAQWALCQTAEIVRDSLNPLRYWLRRRVGLQDDQPAAAQRTQFSAWLADLSAASAAPALAAELRRTASCLGALLDLRWPDSLYERLDAEGRFENTLAGLVALILAEARREPLILVLEDVHWLDDASRLLLTRLGLAVAAEADPVPLALIATARPDAPAERLGTTLPQTTLTLTGLARPQLAALAARILAGPVAPALVDLMAARAEGNPLFAEQIVRYLRERGKLVQHDDGWSVASDDDPMLLPADLRVLLVARLDRLARDVRAAVQTAAILGREFDVRLLAQMLRAPADFPELLDAAESADVWSLLEQMRYLFRHALLREAAYAMQVHSRRRQLHALAVAALETVYASDLAPHLGTLAYHAEEADLPQAVDFLQQAGEAAMAAYENRSAVDYFSRALQRLSATDDARRFDLLLAREQCLFLDGEREQAAADVAALGELAARLGAQQQVQALLRRAKLEMSTGAYRAAAATAAAVAGLADAGDDPLSAATALKIWGNALRQQGGFAEAREKLALAVAQAEAAAALGEMANCLNLLGVIHFYLGETEQAEIHFRRGLDVSRRAGDRIAEGNCLQSLGVAAKNGGRLRVARQHYEASLALYQEVGDREGVAVCYVNLGNLLRREGRLSAALDSYDAARRLHRQLGDRARLALAELNSGVLRRDLGQYDRAAVHFEQALALHVDLGDRGLEAFCLRSLGYLFADCGDGVAAAGHLHAALDQARELGLSAVEAAVLTELGVLAIEAARWPEAADRAA